MQTKKRATLAPLIKLNNSEEKDLKREAKKWNKEVKKEASVWKNFSEKNA